MHDGKTPTCQGLQLGAASTVITPRNGGDLAGFIARTEPMTGIHDDLYARALVWVEGLDLDQAAALVTLDVIGLDVNSVAVIRERAMAVTGLPREQIGVACTHTHGGPATYPGRRLGRCDPDYLERLCQKAAKTIATATERLQPVVMRWACGAEPTVGKNRRVAGGIVDRDVPVLRFQRPDGVVTAMLVSYACHPVTLGPNNLLATADFPWYVIRTLEAVYPDAMALFATCCCGQINTGHSSRWRYAARLSLADVRRGRTHRAGRRRRSRAGGGAGRAPRCSPAGFGVFSRPSPGPHRPTYCPLTATAR